MLLKNEMNRASEAVDCHVIPYEDKYVIYQPLKKLAFITNAGMVNLIQRCIDRPAVDPETKSSDAWKFLDNIGFFEPDPEAPPEPDPMENFKPDVAVLFLTTRCNFRCVYCYASAGEAEFENLPLEKGCLAIDNVYENAVEQGMDRFTLAFHGGGEPSLEYDKIKKLVDYAGKKDIPCFTNLTTNGYWSGGRRDWFFQNINEFSISFDGLREIQDRQRPLASGRGSYAGVMDTIRAMDDRSITYGIRLTVMDDGIENLPKNIDFLCRETGCSTFQVEPAFNHGRAHENHNALTNQDRFIKAFLKAYDIAFESDRHIYYSGARPWAVTSVFCRAQEKALIVGPDGFLTACYEVYSTDHPMAPQFILGRLGDDGKVLIDHAKREALYRDIQKRREACRNCFCYWHCAGDCPSKTFPIQESDGLWNNERCDMNREITLELILRRIAYGNGLWTGEQESIYVDSEQC